MMIIGILLLSSADQQFMENPLTVIMVIVQVLTAASLIFGGGAILIKLGRVMGSFDQTVKQQSAEIAEIKNEVKSQGNTLTTVAVQKNEIGAMQRDISRMWDIIDDMRRGRGFIVNRPEAS